VTQVQEKSIHADSAVCMLKGAGHLGNYHGKLLFQYLGRQRGNIYFLSLDLQFIKYSTVIG